MVFALDQPARIVLRCDVTEPHISGQRAEERNTFSNEHGHAGDGETLNQTGAQEPLNGDPSIDVEVMRASSRELRNDLSRRPGHLLDDRAAHPG